jgi:hypothetical protein
MRWAVGRCAAITALTALALLATGCQGPGTGIADRIRAANSPIVREVLYGSPGLEGGGERIFVYLIDEATDAQALDLWCQVVIPAGAEQLGPDNVRLYKGGKPAPGGGSLGTTRVLRDPVCPTTVVPSPTGWRGGHTDERLVAGPRVQDIA